MSTTTTSRTDNVIDVEATELQERRRKFASDAQRWVFEADAKDGQQQRFERAVDEFKGRISPALEKLVPKHTFQHVDSKGNTSKRIDGPALYNSLLYEFSEACHNEVLVNGILDAGKDLERETVRLAVIAYRQATEQGLTDIGVSLAQKQAKKVIPLRLVEANGGAFQVHWPSKKELTSGQRVLAASLMKAWGLA